MATFQPLPTDFEPTRATLHAYAHAVGVVPRANAEAHEKWWHVALGHTARGLETHAMTAPGGRSYSLRIDLSSHAVILEVDGADRDSWDMTAGMTGTEMGEAVIAAVAALGVEGDYDREKFESDEARAYDVAVADAFRGVVEAVHEVLTKHRGRVGGEVGPVQLWPHGFDMSFEWFGTRVESYEEAGVKKELPAQCNFGFYPGSRPYFYANPWPFQGEVLLNAELPGSAAWHTDGWEGSILYYDDVAGADDAEAQILDYFEAVFSVAEPTLTS